MINSYILVKEFYDDKIDVSVFGDNNKDRCHIQNFVNQSKSNRIMVIRIFFKSNVVFNNITCDTLKGLTIHMPIWYDRKGIPVSPKSSRLLTIDKTGIIYFKT